MIFFWRTFPTCTGIILTDSTESFLRDRILADVTIAVFHNNLDVMTTCTCKFFLTDTAESFLRDGIDVRIIVTGFHNNFDVVLNFLQISAILVGSQVSNSLLIMISGYQMFEALL